VQVCYHDALCPVIQDDGHTRIPGLPMRSVPLTPALLEVLDAVVIVTDHTSVDYAEVVDHASLVIDTRGVMRTVSGPARVVGLSGKETAAPAPQRTLYAVAG
jgi:UDP-N-acetyl-D-glucosamine dehydrogenase